MKAVMSAVPVGDEDVASYKETRKDAIKAAYDREFNTRWSEPKRARVSGSS